MKCWCFHLEEARCLWIMKSVRVVYRLDSVNGLRELCEAMRRWAHRKSVHAYYDASERNPLSCSRLSLPTLRAVDLGPAPLASVSLQVDFEDCSQDTYFRSLPFLEGLGAGAIHGRLSFFATEASIKYDHRLKTDLVVALGRREKASRGTSPTYFCALDIGGLSRAMNDSEYRTELFQRSFAAMFPNGEVRAINSLEGPVLRAVEPFWIDVRAQDMRDRLPIAIEICGFRSYQQAAQSVRGWLEAVPATVDVARLFLCLRPDDYEAKREELNRFATPWEFYLMGRLNAAAQPFVNRAKPPDGSSDWLPLVQWWRRRKVEGLQLEYYFLLALDRNARRFELEVTSNCEDLEQVLRDSREGTGIAFQVAPIERCEALPS